jgi:hypothetical protein
MHALRAWAVGPVAAEAWGAGWAELEDKVADEAAAWARGAAEAALRPSPQTSKV